MFLRDVQYRDRYAATNVRYWPSVSCYALAMGCPVLTSRMLLPGGGRAGGARAPGCRCRMLLRDVRTGTAYAATQCAGLSWRVRCYNANVGSGAQSP
eukprot:3582805-Rhodomonas_salina.2